jgi:hypothetical protein
MIAIAKANAIPKPSIGGTIISVNVFSTTAITIALLPPAINPELIRPPINAWLLDDGSPNYQVIKSQTIAPISPANLTYTVENSGCIIPIPISVYRKRALSNRNMHNLITSIVYSFYLKCSKFV